MAFLRQKIKKKLIEKQNKRYKDELLRKTVTYEKWIVEQDEKAENDNAFRINLEKYLIIESKSDVEDGKRIENEGNTSKDEKNSALYSIVDENSQSTEKTFFAHISVENLYKNTETILNLKKLDYIVLSICQGEVREPAWGMIYRGFHDPEVVLVYGDEDQAEGKEGGRRSPWLKPDWSPDRFLAGFYLGGMVAVRASTLKTAWEDCSKRGIFRRISEQAGAGEWIYLLLFEMLRAENCFSKRSDEKNAKVYHIRHVLFGGKQNNCECLKNLKLPDFCAEELIIGGSENEKEDVRNTSEDKYKDLLLSIIIPSKDNPGVLFHCLDSLLDRTTTRYSFEILVVDNGSGEENRQRISEKLEKIKGRAGVEDVVYRYQPMAFNFSKMCNLGAEIAAGGILLFLNDDMEIVQEGWMDRMVEKALLPWAGAVGAKLLYPDSDTIQHAGITNLRVGPAHKLQYLSDQEEHYFGMNRGVHNMLAVTGACLMVRRDVFREAGGFCEELAVAFNDVDLCYTIYEKGYYNIVRNDVRLFHHESLSRGKDGESEEKQLRHLREKDLLYERHLSLYGRDPFYHPWLLNDMLDSRYSMAYANPVTLDMPWSRVVSCEKALARAREDACLVVGMECARDIYRWLHSLPPEKLREASQPQELGYYFQGYSFIVGADNACYKKKLLLQNKETGRVMAICADARCRQDIQNNLPDQMNVGLTGFAARLPGRAIPAGIYRFGILAEDRCSRQKLVNWSNWVMEVEADGRESVREGREQRGN